MIYVLVCFYWVFWSGSVQVGCGVLWVLHREPFQSQLPACSCLLVVSVDTFCLIPELTLKTFQICCSISWSFTTPGDIFDMHFQFDYYFSLVLGFLLPDRCNRISGLKNILTMIYQPLQFLTVDWKVQTSVACVCNGHYSRHWKSNGFTYDFDQKTGVVQVYALHMKCCGVRLVLKGRVGSCSSPAFTLSELSMVGIQVERDVTLEKTI